MTNLSLASDPEKLGHTISGLDTEILISTTFKISIRFLVFKIAGQGL